MKNNWRDRFYKNWYLWNKDKEANYITCDAEVESFIDQLLTEMAKEMIGKSKTPYDFKNDPTVLNQYGQVQLANGYYIKRQELIKIAKKYGVEVI